MGWDYDSRLIAEEDSLQYEADLSPEELSEMERRQQAERETDYFGQWPTIDDLDEVLEVIKDGY